MLFYSVFQTQYKENVPLVPNHKCDAIWENPSDVAKQHFEKWLETVSELVYNSIELLNIIKILTLDVNVMETKFEQFLEKGHLSF